MNSVNSGSSRLLNDIIIILGNNLKIPWNYAKICLIVDNPERIREVNPTGIVTSKILFSKKELVGLLYKYFLLSILYNK